MLRSQRARAESEIESARRAVDDVQRQRGVSAVRRWVERAAEAQRSAARSAFAQWAHWSWVRSQHSAHGEAMRAAVAHASHTAAEARAVHLTTLRAEHSAELTAFSGREAALRLAAAAATTSVVSDIEARLAAETNALRAAEGALFISFACVYILLFC